MRSYIQTLLILLFTYTLVYSQDSPELVVAYEKLNKRDYNAAIKDFDKIISAKSDNLSALCGRAEAKMGLGKYSEAFKDLDAALEKDGTFALAYSLKGDLFFNQKDYQHALKYYDEAMQRPNSPMQAVIGKSKVFNLTNKIKDAFNILNNAIVSYPNSPDLFYARGLLYSFHKKYSKAITDLDKTLALNPNYNSLDVYLNRGIAFYNVGEYMNAISDYDAALDIDPKNSAVYHSRGLAYYDNGSFKEAIDDFLKLNELNPNNPVTLFNLGMAFNKEGDIENACIYFHKSCQLKNTNACKMVVLTCTDTKSK